MDGLKVKKMPPLKINKPGEIVTDEKGKPMETLRPVDMTYEAEERYNENTGQIEANYYSYGGEEAIDGVTAEDLLQTNEQEYLPANAGMRTPGPVTGKYTCPLKQYRNIFPIEYMFPS